MSDKPKTDLAPGEMALIIRAINWEDGDDWQGEINTSMIIHPEGDVPKRIKAHMLDVVTMMSAFLSVAEEFPEVYEIVEERRNELMGIDMDEALPDKSVSVTKVGNVYTIDKWTKTEGNC